MSYFEKIYRCFRGPKLFRRHRDEDRPKYEDRQAKIYTPNIMEATGNKFISVLRFCFSFSYWTSPVVLSLLYRRGYCSVDGVISLGKLGISLSVIYLVAWLLRGKGRWDNWDYIMFLDVLMKAQKSQEYRKQLSKFDFEFWAWPVDYSVGASRKDKNTTPKSPSPAVGSISKAPLSILSYMCAHTFGRRMMYPGSTALINTLLESMLIQERGRLVDECKGRRVKVQTEDKNEIDTMFIDRRPQGQTPGQKGNILVITCEGNSGFYEIGCTKTPLDAGYSVLGWNHPGFAGSSGSPTPDQDQLAMDAVMQYAINKLNFPPENIWLFAWSIGGYPASWAAKTYPTIKCVTLDATFDHVEPLAVARMPQFARGLVSHAIRTYLNLNNLEQISEYPGPVMFVRRTQDEMITTRPLEIGETPMMALPSNRGNDLLIGFLKHRYPNIVDSTTIRTLERWLAEKTEGQYVIYTDHGVNDKECNLKLKHHFDFVSDTFPSQIGADYSEDYKKKMALYLASKHLKNFDTTHCTPLPHDRFEEPWRAGTQDTQSR
ncbi:phosphatidylserine lipase ABHD16A-like [Ylistrum balloti]|uniref:phosphatidylserine lipase ABHD16A-like n=1 Tax=Ylistrum balloti TaxID=509963 RepID=UPI002905D120|nr:phosphatidylserine lipase ABHD16A-like [Ylistrum balloti]